MPAMVSVADLGGPDWAAAVNVTVPLPEPAGADVIVSQLASLVAVHPQPFAAVTFTVPVPPLDGTFALVGDSEYVQPWPCVSVNVRPAIVIVAVLAAPVVAAAAYWTSPLPLPLPPEVIDSQDALLVADHSHPAAAATPIVPVPPAAGKDAVSGEMLYEQPVPCDTVTVRPAMVTLPVLAGPVVAATTSVTKPSPTPDAGPWIEIHGTSTDADQAQPPVAVT